MKTYGHTEKGDVSKLVELDLPTPTVGPKGKIRFDGRSILLQDNDHLFAMCTGMQETQHVSLTHRTVGKGKGHLGESCRLQRYVLACRQCGFLLNVTYESSSNLTQP